MFEKQDYSAIIPAVKQLAVEAACAIMGVYETEFSTMRKDDNSPVTDADTQANAIIVRGLKVLTPHIPIVSEEEAIPVIDPSQPFWLVDPLDGTRSFVARDGQFTVNIALIEEGVPTLGVVQLPATGMLYWAAKGLGAWCSEAGEKAADTPLKTRPFSDEGFDIVASKSYAHAKMDEWLTRVRVRQFVKAGSSLKFCRVAEAVADIYPRFGRTMEWDTAAGQAIVEMAGGVVTDTEGNRLRYGKEGFFNPPFIAAGNPLSLPWK